ncbi:MAG: ParB/RepB/Spo0J family partition protein [Acidimicrobiia bacterium]
MARRGGLGRGLDSLIPPGSGDDTAASFREIPISSITANRRQPRSRFDEESMAALTASIRELGVLQPVLVRATGNGTFELIAGERRWRASRRAGLSTIPAIVRTADDTASLEQAIVENVQREDLNPMDEAAAYQQLIGDFHLTHDELATRVGKSRAAISNTLRLFQLPPSVQRLLADGQLTAGHARALLSTPDRGFQESLARRAITEGLSVRTVEDIARQHNDAGRNGPGGGGLVGGAAGTATTPGGRLRPPGMHELEDLLAAHLDTRVKVEMGANKGRLVVEFADLEDLERIYRAMTGSPPR